MECQATGTKFHRGVLEEANQHLYQLFWCLPLVVLTVGWGHQIGNWCFTLKHKFFNLT